MVVSLARVAGGVMDLAVPCSQKVLIRLGRRPVDQLAIPGAGTNQRNAYQAALPSPRWLSPDTLAGDTLGSFVGRAKVDITALL